MSFEPGSRIFDYEVAGVLGAGGMGQVYKVRNVISDRIDAMKVLLPDLARQPELADRFLREIKVLASLSHPNIAAFHTALTFENQLIMVMEFVDGVTLSQRLQEGPVPLAEGIKYVDQVLAALSYAHKQGVIHRDIKPANMMVTPEGSIKLMDFGIAKAAADPHLTRTGTTVGSLHYISPEQLTGSALDARSDLYSLGVTLYEMVTGKRPFEGKSEFSLMTAHLEEAPRPPRDLAPDLPPALNSVILMAMAKNPGDRFQSAGAFRAALAEAAKGANPLAASQETAVPPPAAQPLAQPAPLPTEPQSHRGVWMLLGAAIAIAIIVASAVELPKYFRARALTKAPAAATAMPSPPSSSPQTPVAPGEPAAASVATPQAAAGASARQQQTSGASAAAAPAPIVTANPSEARVSGNRSQAHVTCRAETPRASAASLPSVPPASQPAASASRAGDTPAPAAASNAPTQQVQEAQQDLQALQDRLDQLAGRANAVKTSIDSLAQQVASTGQSLRPDVVASESRMERYMDEADAAFAAHNAGSAKHAMDLAEKEIGTLESFLGR